MKKTWLFLIYAFMGASAFIQGTAVASDDEIDIVKLSPKSAAALKNAQEQVGAFSLSPVSDEEDEKRFEGYRRLKRPHDQEISLGHQHFDGGEVSASASASSSMVDDPFNAYKRLRRHEDPGMDQKRFAESRAVVLGGNAASALLKRNDGGNGGSSEAEIKKFMGKVYYIRSGSKIGPRHRKLLGYVKNGVVDRAKLTEKMGVSRVTLKVYLNVLYREKMFSDEDIKKLRSEFMWRDIIAQKIKNKVPLKDILDFCGFSNEKVVGQRSKLSSMISRLYKDGLLTEEDTLYLKPKTGSVGRMGSAKLKILGFLEERSKREPAKMFADLVNEFNQSRFKAARKTEYAVFLAHVRNMRSSKNKYYDRMKKLELFYESCRGSRFDQSS